MTRFKKLKEKIEQDKVNRDITFDELTKYLEHYGYRLNRINGSHHIFTRDNDVLVIPVHGSSVKYYYVLKAREKVKELTVCLYKKN